MLEIQIQSWYKYVVGRSQPSSSSLYVFQQSPHFKKENSNSYFMYDIADHIYLKNSYYTFGLIVKLYEWTGTL